MRRNWFAAMSVGTLFLTAFAFGADTTTDEASAEGVASQALTETVDSSGVTPFGSLEIRPTYYTRSEGQKDGAGLENTVEAGAKLSSNFGLSYVQSFNTNFVRSEKTGASDITADDGYFKANVSNIWVSPDESLSFSYQGRAYLPTLAARRDNGMVTIARNYFTLSKKFNDTVNLSTSLVPIFHFRLCLYF